MTTLQLIAKLKKMNVVTHVFSYNDLNKALLFEIRGIRFSAAYNSSDLQIRDWSTITGWCNESQETERRFFSTFKRLLTFSQR